jgi:hypothetical protein
MLLASFAASEARAGESVGGSCPSGAHVVSDGVVLACPSGTWVATSIQVGNDSTTCASGKAGTVRWTGSALEYCNGSSWTAMSGGGGGGALGDIQTFNASGTWTKPSSGTMAMIECWGGGGGGARYNSWTPGGGGGGGYAMRWMPLSSLGATETVTIGAGGAGRTGSNGNGSNGGTTTFGAHLTADYGRGGNTNGVGIGGGPWAMPGYTGGYSAYAYYDGYSSCTNNYAEDTYYGGAGGGGAGGGCNGTSTPLSAGTTVYGGAGGAGGNGVAGGNGTQPGGGGGGAKNANGGNGAAGRCKVTTF